MLQPRNTPADGAATESFGQPILPEMTIPVEHDLPPTGVALSPDGSSLYTAVSVAELDIGFAVNTLCQQWGFVAVLLVGLIVLLKARRRETRTWNRRAVGASVVLLALGVVARIQPPAWFAPLPPERWMSIPAWFSVRDMLPANQQGWTRGTQLLYRYDIATSSWMQLPAPPGIYRSNIQVLPGGRLAAVRARPISHDSGLSAPDEFDLVCLDDRGARLVCVTACKIDGLSHLKYVTCIDETADGKMIVGVSHFDRVDVFDWDTAASTIRARLPLSKPTDPEDPTRTATEILLRAGKGPRLCAITYPNTSSYELSSLSLAWLDEQRATMARTIPARDGITVTEPLEIFDSGLFAPDSSVFLLPTPQGIAFVGVAELLDRKWESYGLIRLSKTLPGSFPGAIWAGDSRSVLFCSSGLDRTPAAIWNCAARGWSGHLCDSAGTPVQLDRYAVAGFSHDGSRFATVSRPDAPPSITLWKLPSMDLP